MIAIFFVLTLAAAVLECAIPDSLGAGYIVNYYLKQQSTVNLDVDFLYSLDDSIPDGSVRGVTDLDFTIENTNIVGYSVYNFEIDQAWFSLQMMGYFVPSTSGDYTFSITGVDDQVLVRLGDSVAFSCFDTSSGSTQQDSIYASGKTSVIGTGDTEVSYYFEKGFAYPIKISYSNSYYSAGSNAARLGFVIKDNLGNNVSNYVFYDLKDGNLTCLAVQHTTTFTSTVTVVMSTQEMTTVTQSQDTITETETVTFTETQCSATITEWVNYAAGSQLTIYTTGSVAGTWTHVSCQSFKA